MDILIVGSCVSRDALEFDELDCFNLVAYHSRSSFGTLGSEKTPINFQKSLDNITSSFQRRMVKYDFNHDLLEVVVNKSFDILLMDLIDERFHLAILDKKYRVTRSNEFIKTGLKGYSIVNTHSEEFINYWKEGVDLFFSILLEEKLVKKVRLQKAYWTNIIDNGEISDTYTDEMIDKQNRKLNLMYEYLKKYLSDDQFVSIPNNLIKIKSNHKWGISPFHYVDDYYKYLLNKINCEEDLVN